MPASVSIAFRFALGDQVRWAKSLDPARDPQEVLQVIWRASMEGTASRANGYGLPQAGAPPSAPVSAASMADREEVQGTSGHDL